MSLEQLPQCLSQGVQAALRSGASPSDIDYKAIARHCYESGGAPSAGLPASGPSSASAPGTAPGPHYSPGSCPEWFKWCPSQQACIPLGKTCDAHACPPWKKWCAPQNACIPNHASCGRCPEGHIWCPALNRCIRPWDEYCPSAPIPTPTTPGSSMDSHGCRLDSGYSWCEPLQQCVQPWVTPCTTPAGYDQPSADGLPYVSAGANAMANEMNLTMPAYKDAKKEFRGTNIMASGWDMAGTRDGGMGSQYVRGTSSINSQDSYGVRGAF